MIARLIDGQRPLRSFFQLLKGDAYTTLRPFQGRASNVQVDRKHFIEDTTRIFSDSGEKATATQELDKLKQGNRDFSRYHADFVRLVATLLESAPYGEASP